MKGIKEAFILKRVSALDLTKEAGKRERKRERENPRHSRENGTEEKKLGHIQGTEAVQLEENNSQAG